MGGVVGKRQLATASAESLSTDGHVITSLQKEMEHSPPPKKVKIGPRFVKLGLSKDRLDVVKMRWFDGIKKMMNRNIHKGVFFFYR